jgi:hypothetical protein
MVRASLQNMPRKPGPQSAAKSHPVSLRLPNDLYEAVCAAARIPVVDGEADKDAFKQLFPEWGRNALRAATGRSARTPTEAMKEGFAEGKRQGWAHSNKVFREALGVAAGKLK